MIKISDQNNDFGAVLICAVRYCIGRQNYMPGLVIDFIRPLLPKLDSKTLTVMERDIIEAAGKDGRTDSAPQHHGDYGGFTEVDDDQLPF